MGIRGWLLGLVGALVCLVLPALARPAYAHAVIVRSEPAANARLAETPHEVRLWFTEPLEASYSTIELRDATGALISTPPSFIEPADDHQMVLMVGDLSEGLYTVVWRNVSSADGHRQTGSFPFVVGEASGAESPAAMDVVKLTQFDLLSRWTNFWGLVQAVGSVAFIVLVWQPAMRGLTNGVPESLWTMAWFGWLAAGVGAALLLLNQTAILLDQPLREASSFDNIVNVINTTRFGTLWLWRLGLWGLMGVLLVIATYRTRATWLAMICGLLMLLPMSLHSHAAVSNEAALSIFSDWVHLAMCALWMGGLVQFLVAIPALRRLLRQEAASQGTTAEPRAPRFASTLGVVAAQFSSVARVAVVGLVATGIYATWNQVTTLEALTTTFYGRLLIFKLLLALILLATAGVNLLWTQRRLLAGQAVWVGRLRVLLSIEVALLFGILMATGGMTALNPARNEVAQREAAAAIPPAPQTQPIHLVKDVDDLQIHFTATPGWVGNSDFVIQLVNRSGEAVTDASLIRMRFQHQTENLGESELQIQPEREAVDGVYSIEGANLSTVGDWRVRMTVQRPDAFDAMADLEFAVIAPPPPPPAPVVEENPVLPYRTPVLLLTGFPAALFGALFLLRERLRFWQGAGVLAVLLALLGLAYVVTGFLPPAS